MLEHSFGGIPYLCNQMMNLLAKRGTKHGTYFVGNLLPHRKIDNSCNLAFDHRLVRLSLGTISHLISV